MSAVEFWYEFASPYSYIAAARIQRLAGERSLTVLWRPLLLGPIFSRREHDPTPFQNAGPVQNRYRRRDVERLCAREGLALNWPTRYPRNGLLAARAALIADDEGWCPEFSLAVYRANFVEDREISDPAVIGQIVAGLGRPGDELLARAQSAENKARLAAQVETAIGKGIFGAPTIVVDGELFWGNDRLEQALDWATRPWLPGLV